ncbi:MULTISPECIES: Scr1 family TA system antitoxin-like transcriptional regulator [Streptomyces]|uniref:Scr1 family TA system antitoxin-like transcriptional regulator n=1 Tax=Streptomyces TaxID=1883 RepID=UPI00163C5999|nr:MULTISPECIES: Scr1 family TA system antitoxin-like transcriptional regulator [Streptomyces]MBC2875450.1 hypothetical protein [Streptomyces sp. TYQ1024]UBI35689.1 Scr1 family TA system antitoxin-like transcriptional regulator [Streptomyces mobaraensis]UKW28283.1 Scr1 family TA system antitoxin-like transcriptional regulator [Streptomyces sp. TYQ1024]
MSDESPDGVPHHVPVPLHCAAWIRVIPYAGGVDGILQSGFKIYSFGDKDIPDVAFSDSVLGNTTVDDPRDLRRLRRLFGSLSSVALPPDETRDLIVRSKDKEI